MITGVKDLNVRDRYSFCQSQNQRISLENKRSLKQSSRLKITYTIPTFLLISWHSRYMVRIRVIWLSVKYLNFYSLQNVTNAYPPHAVNVPFISSHIKISRSSLEPNLSTWQCYFPCSLLFCMFFFNLMLNLILF